MLPELEIELAVAESEAEAEAARFAAVNHRITAHVAFMQNNFGPEVAELLELHRKLRGTSDEPPAQDIPRADPIAKAYELREREAKAILRRIRQRCHPDKTDDPELHETFELATDAFERRDMEALRALGRSVGPVGRGRRPSRAERLRSKLRLLKEKTTALRAQLLAATTSQVFKEMTNVEVLIKEKGLETATAIIRRNIKAAIFEAKSTLESRKRGVWFTSTSSSTTSY